MSDPYLGEIRIFAGTFAPVNWAMCEGQLLQIAQYDALFSLIGTTYGGDGLNTFALPDLRGRLPIHQGGGFVTGEAGGAEQVTLTAQQLAGHTHPLMASTALATQESTGRERDRADGDRPLRQRVALRADERAGAAAGRG